mmetsp:Transcript_75569/g.152871  ORF Transcript_75569/g.152871 Transcript_75569/m.152871 type:complete len:213 (+) Transcript_75569:444-1082(+)
MQRPGCHLGTPRHHPRAAWPCQSCLPGSRGCSTGRQRPRHRRGHRGSRSAAQRCSWHRRGGPWPSRTDPGGRRRRSRSGPPPRCCTATSCSQTACRGAQTSRRTRWGHPRTPSPPPGAWRCPRRKSCRRSCAMRCGRGCGRWRKPGCTPGGRGARPWHPESPTSAGATMGALAGGCGRHWRTRRHPTRLQTAPRERRSGQRQQAGEWRWRTY